MLLGQYLLTDDGFKALFIAAKQLKCKLTLESEIADIDQALELLKEARRRCIRAERLDYFAHYLFCQAEALIKKTVGDTDFAQFTDHFRLTRSSAYAVSAKESTIQRDILVNFNCYEDAFFQFARVRSKNTNELLFEQLPGDGLPEFPIIPGTCLTLVGHCAKGAKILSTKAKTDKKQCIEVGELADGIAKNLKGNVDTPFTIHLVACEAADGNPSFAYMLMNELVSRGITNVIVKASKPILFVDYESGDIYSHSTFHLFSKRHVLDQKKFFWSAKLEKIQDGEFTHHERLCEEVYEQLAILKEKPKVKKNIEWVARIEHLQDKIAQASTPEQLRKILWLANNDEGKDQVAGGQSLEIKSLCQLGLISVAKFQHADSDLLSFEGLRARAAEHFFDLAAKLAAVETTPSSWVEDIFTYRAKILDVNTPWELSDVLKEMHSDRTAASSISGVAEVVEAIRTDVRYFPYVSFKAPDPDLDKRFYAQAAFLREREALYVRLNGVKYRCDSLSANMLSRSIEQLMLKVTQAGSPNELIACLAAAKCEADQFSLDARLKISFINLCKDALARLRVAQETVLEKQGFLAVRAHSAKVFRQIAEKIIGKHGHDSLVNKVFEYRDKVLAADDVEQLVSLLKSKNIEHDLEEVKCFLGRDFDQYITQGQVYCIDFMALPFAKLASSIANSTDIKVGFIKNRFDLYKALSEKKIDFLLAGQSVLANEVDELQEEVTKADSPSALIGCLTKAKYGRKDGSLFEKKEPKLFVFYDKWLAKIRALQELDCKKEGFVGVQARAACQFRLLAESLASEHLTRHSLVVELYGYRDDILRASDQMSLSDTLKNIKARDRQNHILGFKVSGLDQVITSIEVDNEDFSELKFSPVDAKLSCHPEVHKAFIQHRQELYSSLSALRAKYKVRGHINWADDIKTVQDAVKQAVSPTCLINCLNSAKWRQDHLPFNRTKISMFHEVCDSWLEKIRRVQEVEGGQSGYLECREKAAASLQELALQLTDGATTCKELVQEVNAYRDRVLSADTEEQLSIVLADILKQRQPKHGRDFCLNGLDVLLKKLMRQLETLQSSSVGVRCAGAGLFESSKVMGDRKGDSCSYSKKRSA